MFRVYVSEIKKRVFLILLSSIVTMMTCYLYKNVLLFLLIKLNFKLYNLKLFYFITTNLSDVFTVCLKCSYFISLQFLIVLIIYHSLMFLSPGLFNFEYKVLKLFVFICVILFILSLLLLHLYILPFLWEFFLSFQENCKINVFFESKLTEYFEFYQNIYFIVILISQSFSFLIVHLLLTSKKIIFITTSRKIVYFSFILIATLVTPPDIISQILIGTGLILFYECLILSVLFKEHIKK